MIIVDKILLSIIILLGLFIPIGIALINFRKYRYRLQVKDNEIVLITLLKKINLPFRSIKRVNLVGHLHVGYYVQLSISYTHNGKENIAFIPLSTVLSGPTYKIQIGEHKETLQKLVDKLPKEKVDPPLIEFLSKNEMNFSKICKSVGSGLYKVRLK